MQCASASPCISSSARTNRRGKCFRRRTPRLRQAGRHTLVRHWLHERIVERVEEHKRRDETRPLRRLEERRRRREVYGRGELSLGSRTRECGSDQCQSKHPNHEASCASAHRNRLLPLWHVRGLEMAYPIPCCGACPEYPPQVEGRLPSHIWRKWCGKTGKICLASYALACYVAHQNQPRFRR